MADNNGWAEHKRLVLGKLDEYGEDIRQLKNDVSEIKITIAPVTKMARNVEELVRHQAVEDRVAASTGVHQLPQKPSTFKKIASNDWFKLMIMGLVMGSLSVGAFQCNTPNGYSCQAQDVHKEASK